MPHPSLPRHVEVLQPDDDHDESPVRAAAQQILNAAIRGRLEVDYDTRTVVFRNIDGDHALRLLALGKEFDAEDPTSARWADRLDPRTADAGCRWITFRPNRVLSIRWFPERILIDDEEHRAKLRLALALLDIDEADTVLADHDPDAEDNDLGPDDDGEESDDEPAQPTTDDTDRADDGASSERASPPPPPE